VHASSGRVMVTVTRESVEIGRSEHLNAFITYLSEIIL
jgi:hypothetical protein